MEWWKVVALVLVIVVILFPAAYVWGMNIGGTFAAIKRARQKRAVRAKVALGEQENYLKGDRTPVKRVAFAALFFLVAILFPVLIWEALFVAVRQPLLRAAKRAGYASLFLLAGISMPVLIWVGFVAAMRRPLLQAVRRVAYAAWFLLVGVCMPILIWGAFVVAIREPLLQGISQLALRRRQMSRLKGTIRRIAYVPLFFLFAILMPVLVWIAGAVAIRELLLRWRESRLPSVLVCRIDNDCPRGYICIGGRCVPQY